MVARYYIQEGLIVKKQNSNDKDYAGLFSLDKWFKKLLGRYKINFVDDCCEAPETYPVRYNPITPGLEYYDPSTKTWTAVS